MELYESYKDSGVAWIGKVPEHWEVMKTSLLYTNIGSGTTPSTSKQEYYEDDGFCWLQTGDLNDGYITDTSKKISKVAIKDCKLRFYPVGSIVIAMYGATIGKIGLLKVPTSTNQACCVLPYSNKMNEIYTFYVCQIAKGQMLLEAVGGGQPNISQDIIKKLKLPVPPICEQQAIAAYLDKRCSEIDNAITTQQKRIALLQELKQSIITRVVTQGIHPDVPLKESGVEWIGKVPEHWEVRRLKSICQSKKYAIKTGPFGTQLKGQDLYPEGDIRVYNQRNVIDDNFNECSFYVTHKKASDLKSFYTQPNDLLITSRGTIGKCSILPDNVPMGILHPCLIAVRIDQKICTIEWAKLFIGESNCFATNIFLNSNATTIDVIYTDTLKNVIITIPPVFEQKKIIAYIDQHIKKLDSIIKKANKRIEYLQELRQSVITEAITGKIKVC